MAEPQVSHSERRPPAPIPMPLHGYIWRETLDMLVCLITPIIGNRPFNDTYGPGFIYRERTVSGWDRILYFIGILNRESVRQLHWDLNCWKDEQFHAWKEAYIANCTAVAVAAAVFASLGLSTLSLDSLGGLHWMVRALFSSSMLLGVFAVYFATSLQQTIALLNNVFYFRLWLSKGLPSKKQIAADRLDTYRYLPLDASAATLRLLAIPQRLLNMSILLYVIGFGVYLLLHWKANQNNDYRNIFIVYVAIIGAAFIDYVITSGFILLDARKRYTEFGIGSLSFHKSEMRKKIEVSLAEIQRVLLSEEPNSTHEDDHETLKRIVHDLEAMVDARKLRRRISKVPTDKELGIAQRNAQQLDGPGRALP